MTVLHALYAMCFLLFCIACLLLWIGNHVAWISKQLLGLLEHSDPVGKEGHLTREKANDFD